MESEGKLDSGLENEMENLSMDKNVNLIKLIYRVIQLIIQMCRAILSIKSKI